MQQAPEVLQALGMSPDSLKQEIIQMEKADKMKVQCTCARTCTLYNAVMYMYVCYTYIYMYNVYIPCIHLHYSIYMYVCTFKCQPIYNVQCVLLYIYICISTCTRTCT